MDPLQIRPQLFFGGDRFCQFLTNFKIKVEFLKNICDIHVTLFGYVYACYFFLTIKRLSSLSSANGKLEKVNIEPRLSNHVGH